MVTTIQWILRNHETLQAAMKLIGWIMTLMKTAPRVVVLSQIPVDAENDHDDPGSDDTDESIDLNQKKKLINGKDVRNAKNHGTEEAKSEESEEASLESDDSSV
mmetsp:Transcript_63309/g.72563  ORF Transcript_63309/g.72563 Transcript_63309/m.72563 type:complete len:104 (-) Transcript_63309:310-621(-)